jgi:hypothetical protein
MISKIPVCVCDTSIMRDGGVVYFVLFRIEGQQEYGRGVNAYISEQWHASSSAQVGNIGIEMLVHLIGMIISGGGK